MEPSLGSTFNITIDPFAIETSALLPGATVGTPYTDDLLRSWLWVAVQLDRGGWRAFDEFDGCVVRNTHRCVQQLVYGDGIGAERSRVEAVHVGHQSHGDAGASHYDDGAERCRDRQSGHHWIGRDWRRAALHVGARFRHSAARDLVRDLGRRLRVEPGNRPAVPDRSCDATRRLHLRPASHGPRWRNRDEVLHVERFAVGLPEHRPAALRHDARLQPGVHPDAARARRNRHLHELDEPVH